MLVLSRKLGEQIVIDDHIVVTVLRLEKGQVRWASKPPGRLRSSVRRSLLTSTARCNRSSEGYPDRRSKTVRPGSGRDTDGTEACHRFERGTAPRPWVRTPAIAAEDEIASPPRSCHRPTDIAPTLGKVGLQKEEGCWPSRIVDGVRLVVVLRVRLSPLLVVELGPPAAPLAASPGRVEPGSGPLADEVPLVLGQGGEHVEDEFVDALRRVGRPRRRLHGGVPPEQARLDAIRARSDERAAVLDLADGFADLIRKRSPETLGEWLARGEASPDPGLRRFAEGIRRDEAASARRGDGDVEQRPGGRSCEPVEDDQAADVRPGGVRVTAARVHQPLRQRPPNSTGSSGLMTWRSYSSPSAWACWNSGRAGSPTARRAIRRP